MLVISSTSRAGSTRILLASCLWGTTGVAAVLVEGSPVSVGAARIIVGGALLAVVGRRGLAGLPGHGAGLLFAAVCVAVFQIAYFASVARTGVAVGTVVTIGSGPAFAGLISRSGLTPRWTAATVAAVAGCALLTGGGDADSAGVVLALLSGLSWAGYAAVVAGLIGRGLDDRAVAGATFGLAAVLLLPVFLGGSSGWAFTGTGALVVLYLGAVTTTGGYLLYVRGLRTVPVAVAMTLTLAEPAVAAVLGLIVLGERLSPAGFAGLALVGVSLVVLVRGRT